MLYLIFLKDNYVRIKDGNVIMPYKKLQHVKLAIKNANTFMRFLGMLGSHSTWGNGRYSGLIQGRGR